MRRIGESVRPDIRYGRRPGAYAILLRGDDVLLTLQEGEDPVPQLPGGGIDPGEQVLPALHREVMEETGWSIAAPRRLGAFRRFNWMPDYGRWAEKICQVYLARPVRRVGPPTEPGHHAVWMPLADAARELDPRLGRHFLQALQAGKSRPSTR
ncbi:NUDIX domain-containing protein [Wenxinia marina]|uniref:ADP-ribose pyrophosphatase n=1 Tax=Wenxinia marina DSM 24838 TaxID=1123501 RepID=A0A0D0QFE5_9RHOB|nr:NUDIX hydrolase [Wenxinia marina]KIQ71037.1 ADP-ribose pyrophosphatase [Wenxinia marina DSM 24838]GGL55386.1 NUDIX hydrolase [Wenxinia marina]